MGVHILHIYYTYTVVHVDVYSIILYNILYAYNIHYIVTDTTDI